MAITELKSTTARLPARHETFAQQLVQIIEAIRLLTAVPATTARPIGFVVHQDKKERSK